MAKKIDVYGLSGEQQAVLRKLAEQRLSKPSLSLLAKTLLLEQLESPPPPAIEAYDEPPPNKRITLRLPDYDRAWLQQAAEQGRTSINQTVRDIIQSHIRDTPFYPAVTTDALYQSNYQLLRIGRNINQIARQLNAGEHTSLTTRHIEELKAVIDAHTARVNEVLQSNRKRQK